MGIVTRAILPVPAATAAADRQRDNARIARARSGVRRAEMSLRDDARFYHIGGRRLPSVTTVIGVINKPALLPWAAKMERRALEAAMLMVATKYPLIPAEVLLERVSDAVRGAKAAEQEKQQAATIGTA